MNSFQGAWETPEYRKSVLNSTNGLYVCASGIDIMHSLQSNIIRNRPLGRDDYQIIYIQQGCCYYLDRDNRTKKAESNSIILFKPHEPQIYQYKMTDETTAYWTHFNGSMAEQTLKAFDFDFRCHTLKSAPKKYISASTNIIDELRQKRPGYRDICSAELYRLFAYLHSYISMEASGFENKYSPAIEIVINEMNKTYSCNYPISYYSNMCDLEENYFIKLFKSQVGMTPHSYIIKLRLESAATLLKETNLKIENISLTVGYENIYYFMRIFKKNFGISAGEFRKQSIKNLPKK